MELPATVEWGLHCTWLLAHVPTDVAVSTRRLAEFHGVPQDYLAKTLKSLTRAGVLVATSGPRGGYRLARSPEAITVLEIVTALEGGAPLFRCQEIRQNGPCPLPRTQCRRPCGIASVMHRAEDVWRTELSRTTLADLLTHASISSTDRARRWLAATAVDRGGPRQGQP